MYWWDWGMKKGVYGRCAIRSQVRSYWRMERSALSYLGVDQSIRRRTDSMEREIGGVGVEGVRRISCSFMLEQIVVCQNGEVSRAEPWAWFRMPEREYNCTLCYLGLFQLGGLAAVQSDVCFYSFSYEIPLGCVCAVIHCLSIINMDFNLNDFKFMQGFAVARNILVELKNLKHSACHLNQKTLSTNSLPFSPIARRQSHLIQQSSDQSPHKHKRSPSLQPIHKPFTSPQQIPQQSSPTSNLKTIFPIDQLKDKINSIIGILKQESNQLTISEMAFDVLTRRLQGRKKDYREIQKLRNQEREKHFRIMSLKNAIGRKRERLVLKRSVRERWREAVAQEVKGYIKDSYEDQSIQIVPLFTKEFKIVESKQNPQSPIQQPSLQYPQQFSLNFTRIKKKQKKKLDAPIQQKILPPPALQPVTSFFDDSKKNKNFETYDAEIQTYCDDTL